MYPWFLVWLWATFWHPAYQAPVMTGPVCGGGFQQYIAAPCGAPGVAPAPVLVPFGPEPHCRPFDGGVYCF